MSDSRQPTVSGQDAALSDGPAMGRLVNAALSLWVGVAAIVGIVGVVAAIVVRRPRDPRNRYRHLFEDELASTRVDPETGELTSRRHVRLFPVRLCDCTWTTTQGDDGRLEFVRATTCGHCRERVEDKPCAD